MKIIPIKTRKVIPPKDDIYNVLDKYCNDLKDGDVLLITSKIIAIHQGLCVAIAETKNKDYLIKKEAEAFIPREESPGGYVILTLKENTMIASAGIDESNSKDYYVLWPKESHKEAKKNL